jgi:hypothetical protein
VIIPFVFLVVRPAGTEAQLLHAPALAEEPRAAAPGRRRPCRRRLRGDQRPGAPAGLTYCRASVLWRIWHASFTAHRPVFPVRWPLARAPRPRSCTLQAMWSNSPISDFAAITSRKSTTAASRSS